MANKFTSVELVLDFWEAVVARNDPRFLFFFLVSHVINNREKIFDQDIAILPETMTQLKISSAKELDILFSRADSIKEQTPKSFSHLPELSVIFVRNHPGLRQACSSVEQLLCLPLLPDEVLYYAYHGEIDCSDPTCIWSVSQTHDRASAYQRKLQQPEVRVSKPDHQQLAPVRRQQTPLDTESNITGENQEAPIDQINETARMKHIQAIDECRAC